MKTNYFIEINEEKIKPRNATWSAGQVYIR